MKTLGRNSCTPTLYECKSDSSAALQEAEGRLYDSHVAIVCTHIMSCTCSIRMMEAVSWHAADRMDKDTTVHINEQIPFLM